MTKFVHRASSYTDRQEKGVDLNYFIDAIGTEQRKSESHLNQTKEEVVAIASFKLPFFKGEVMAASIVDSRQLPYVGRIESVVDQV